MKNLANAEEWISSLPVQQKKHRLFQSLIALLRQHKTGVLLN